MKNPRFQIFKISSLFLMALLMTMVSCKKDEPVEDPIASFQFEVDATDYLMVTFTNYSQNAETYAWDFGDGNISTDENPVHTYDAVGTYTVALVATNSAGVEANYSQSITLSDPMAAQNLLDGGSSKTWKLWRGEGSAAGIGPDADNARQWWALVNDGSRPCVFYHEFTFNRDGSFTFDDKGIFWGEVAVFSGTDNNEVCFEAVAANMINSDGADVSAWLGGTHAFTYDPVTGDLTLTGNGAWIGMPQLSTVGEVKVPDATRTVQITLEEMEGYDLMHVSLTYPDAGHYWDFTYASYSDPSLEPDVVTEVEEYGEDLEDFAPETMFNTFASTDAADVSYLVPTESAVVLTVGVDDPADPNGAKVGMFQRSAEMYPDLKFLQDFDIQFDNFTTVSIDVYVPSTNTYSEGGLTTGIQLWIADFSQTQEFWGSWVQYDVDPADIVIDEWKTYTFDLESPTSGEGTPKTRTDLDLVGLAIGGAGHAVDGTFYVRNLVFN